MEQVSVDRVETIVARETWSSEDHKELVSELTAMSNAPVRLKKILTEMESADPDPKGSAALKVGIVRYMLCRFRAALETLIVATDNKDRRYFQGLCHLSLREYNKAADEFARARDRGWNGLEIDMKIIEAKALGGDLQTAEKMLAKVKSKVAETAEFFYLQGLTDDLSGRYEQAMEAYVQARRIDPAHAQATFRLAYSYDLRGEEQEAVELYKELASQSPVSVGALLNLAVLYEDMGKYDNAVVVLKRILAIQPNHARARLFLKDAQSSKWMYFDEDQAKRIARRNAVLDIPVTDFELSVRARNCLKKMKIRTLGDLVRTSEATLLGYKNFGETSLKEIKDMLAAKGLRLGQALEDEEGLPLEEAEESPGRDREGLLSTSLAQLEFSVRSRRALESLKVDTLGDLISHTEGELLACKNFGQTSLNEVRQRLTEFALHLRDAN